MLKVSKIVFAENGKSCFPLWIPTHDYINVKWSLLLADLYIKEEKQNKIGDNLLNHFSF